MADKDDSRELVLAPNESALILDKTNGQVFLYTGPKQDSLAPSVQPVVFNEQTKTFERCDLQAAVRKLTIAPEGWYAVLKNPAKDAQKPHPIPGNKASMPDLDTGRKVIIPGPASFALWPGQMCKVLPGHRLRSNQYLLVRVYDQAAARAEWKNAIIEKAEDSGEGPEIARSDDGDEEPVDASRLTTGQLIVIRGTDTSFFIPPTGVEVVVDQEGSLVRDAASLERLDYALLLAENGSKRFVRGPAVVFPKPTEVFVTREEDGKTTRKFRAIELSETSGIYVKVIADYADESGEHKAGEELFLTGKDQLMYFPREEHAVIRYGEQHEVHYATAIPAGEARYVLERTTGNVRTVHGPAMYLPDPRSEVFARRILDHKTCELLYPGNQEALDYNAALRGTLAADQAAAGRPLTRTSGPAKHMLAAAAALAAPGGAYGGLGAFDALLGESISNSAEDRGLGGLSAKGFTGDGFERKGRYTEPRTITLNTKYAGAVTVDLWTGYAIKLVKRSGAERVEVGPKTVMLDYDESPQVLKLSTGKPKNADTLHKTAFLLCQANKVSDVLDVETRDYCKLRLKLSYRVNFEGDPSKWFQLENYVKFLCDHMRSRLRAEVKRLGVEEFYQAAVEHVRAVVLGDKQEDRPRPGTAFVENGMRIYDVEVLAVDFVDPGIEQLLVREQRDAIDQRLKLGSQRRMLDFTRESEALSRHIEEEKAETRAHTIATRVAELARRLEADVAEHRANATREAEHRKVQVAKAEADSELAAMLLARERLMEEQAITLDAQRQEARLRELSAEVEAVVKKAGAIQPDLVAAINAFGERALIEKISASMAPLAIIGGESVTDVVKRLLDGTKLAQFLSTTPQNGAAPPPRSLPAQGS